MGVMIELTPEQEEAVLASYGYDGVGTVKPPKAPDLPDAPEAVVQDFNGLYGMAFGTPHNGKNADLPLKTKDGLVTWKFYIEGELAAKAGVSDHGGDFHVHTVADELAKWTGGGYDSIITKIEEMGLGDTEYAVFPENIGQVDVYGVAYDGRDWRLEMWQENSLRYTLTGPGNIPVEMFKFTLYQSGGNLGVQYYWK